jgi:hypothetical protein
VAAEDAGALFEARAGVRLTAANGNNDNSEGRLERSPAGACCPRPPLADAIDRAKGNADIPHSRGTFAISTSSYGKPFTQVALVLEPERALRERSPVVLVTSRRQRQRPHLHPRQCRQGGLGPWLARRSVT